MNQGFSSFLLLLGAVWECGCDVGYRANAGPRLRCVLAVTKKIIPTVSQDGR